MEKTRNTATKIYNRFFAKSDPKIEFKKWIADEEKEFKKIKNRKNNFEQWLKTKYMKKLKPIIIKLKNNTDDKFYDVKLIDYDYLQNNKIEYSCITPGITYEIFLRQARMYNSVNTHIFFSKVEVKSFCDYQKFKDIQRHSVLSAVHKELTGDIYTNKKSPEFNVKKRISSYDFNFDCPFFFLSNLIFQHLMPDTTIEVKLYI